MPHSKHFILYYSSYKAVQAMMTTSRSSCESILFRRILVASKPSIMGMLQSMNIILYPWQFSLSHFLLVQSSVIVLTASQPFCTYPGCFLTPIISSSALSVQMLNSLSSTIRISGHLHDVCLTYCCDPSRSNWRLAVPHLLMFISIGFLLPLFIKSTFSSDGVLTTWLKFISHHSMIQTRTFCQTKGLIQ